MFDVLKKVVFPQPKSFSNSMKLAGVNSHPGIEVGGLCRAVLVAPENGDTERQIFKALQSY